LNPINYTPVNSLLGIRGFYSRFYLILFYFILFHFYFSLKEQEARRIIIKLPFSAKKKIIEKLDFEHQYQLFAPLCSPGINFQKVILLAEAKIKEDPKVMPILDESKKEYFYLPLPKLRPDKNPENRKSRRACFFGLARHCPKKSPLAN